MMENLDMTCAALGQELASERDVNEKIITDVLGVVEEQGLYAAFLYLKAQDNKGGKAICQRVDAFLKRVREGTPLSTGNGDVLASVKTLSQNLDDLLLARDLVRQALVYARYHIKARS
jgi:hypothetical protein